ncbi:terpene synthase [Kitasatospora sp. MMS16-BH015]|uniref:terpene synthase family protein n=1 Tax=Kitasatospora sp. MMS16-BH015 TaxID=2018025 RepID=UPI000CA0D901|nr:pentalenene synthase [Kitasatospora sp. MMS16-BH015]AUG81702.1 terpene synthase [Kitasatospora sp. MMS16-BH015]
MTAGPPELVIPFPSRISPDYERAREAHLAWPRSFGLLPGAAEAACHLLGDYAGLAARFHPPATGRDLDLAVDQQSWFFLFDDGFDGPLGRRPHQVRAVVRGLAAVLAGKPGVDPLERAFADLRRRSCRGMSGSWRLRSALAWREYFTGHIAEALARREGVRYSLRQYFEIRRATIGVLPTLDLGERARHAELPRAIHRHRALEELRTLASDIVVIDNDITSLAKECAAGEVNNAVLLLRRDRGCSTAAAIAELRAQARAQLDCFERARLRLTGGRAYQTLPVTERQWVDGYLADGLQAIVRGASDWHRLSRRYVPG